MISLKKTLKLLPYLQRPKGFLTISWKFLCHLLCFKVLRGPFETFTFMEGIYFTVLCLYVSSIVSVFIYSFCVHVCAEVRRQLTGVNVLSFSMAPGIELKASALVANTFTF